jgi:hypothetical protein
MRRLLAVTVALLWSVAAAYAADPVGSYTIKGSNPGDNGKYTGTVTVTKTG